jgi:hypothetical protein
MGRGKALPAIKPDVLWVFFKTLTLPRPVVREIFDWAGRSLSAKEGIRHIKMRGKNSHRITRQRVSAGRQSLRELR